MDKTPLWKVHAAQIVIQLGGAGYYVLAKASLSAGVNSLVFPVYQKLISTCVLAFFSLFTTRVGLEALTPTVMILVVLAAFSGIYLAQITFLAGLALTSGSFAAAIQNSVPVFAFLIAVICRFEVIYWRRRDGQLKLVGVFFCILGALCMSLYQGPIIFGSPPVEQAVQPTDAVIRMYTTRVLALGSERFGLTSWQIGSLLLVLNSLCAATFINFQAAIVARYPAPVSVVGMVTACGVVMLAVSGFFTVKDTSDWIISRPGDLIALFYCGAITSALGFALSTWCVQRGGPFLATAYIPTQAVFSAVFGLIFLGDVVYLGSLLGALAIMIGLFAVTIGQQRQRLLASLSMKLGKMDNIPITHQLLVKTDEEERESERQRTRAQPVLKRLLTTTEDNLKKNPLLRFSSFQYH